MELQEFIKASIDRKAPNNFPVSHPSRGFDIITEDQWKIWKDWGWQKESWDVVVEAPKGVRKRKARKETE